MEKKAKSVLSEDYEDIEEVLVGFQLEGEKETVTLSDCSVCSPFY